jgi:poly(beta-D-mannuronate) lyase
MFERHSIRSRYSMRATAVSLLSAAAVAISGAAPATSYAADGSAAAGAAQVSAFGADASAAITRAASLRTVKVASVAALVKALAEAMPGDRIALADGSYVLGSDIKVTRSGTAENPVVIAAENVGRVFLKGAGTFDIEANHLVVEGFNFTNGATLEVPAIRHHVRVTRNVFQMPSTVKNWVSIAGDDCEIDHNVFQKKKTEGVFLQITGPGTADMAKRTHIHHNQFKEHTFGGANGGESIRLGLSMRQHGQAAALVEDNLFDKANGDPEAISVKSSGNLIRHNTIRNSRGTITLRHGWNNTVDGNMIIGGSSGIRVFGNGHVVINNVVQNSSAAPLLEIGSGDIRDDSKNLNVHEAADHVLVAFNTFVGSGLSANVLRVGDAKEKFTPDDITFANNILSGNVRVEKSTNLTWNGNIITTKSTAVPTLGYRVANPQLLLVDGLYRLSATSPAFGTAVGSYSKVRTDIDGQARPQTRSSVGADEVVVGGVNRVPAVSTVVGPTAP